jgi:ZIP family zinc transporter
MILSLIAGLGTCLGAALVITFGQINSKSLSVFLGLACGVMIAVILFDLLPAAYFYGNIFSCLGGFCGGLLLLLLLELLTCNRQPATNSYYGHLRTGYLIALGIALHDFPEGLAIAAGFATASKLGPALVLAIGLHNIPEGMATAAPLWLGKQSAKRIIGINLLVSLVTPAGTLAGLWLLQLADYFISILLSFAAGAMTYIVFAKLFPESLNQHRRLALTGGFCGMLFFLLLSLLE